MAFALGHALTGYYAGFNMKLQNRFAIISGFYDWTECLWHGSNEVEIFLSNKINGQI